MPRSLAVLLIAGLVCLWIGEGLCKRPDTCTTSYSCMKTSSYRTCTGWWFWRRCSYRTAYNPGTCKKCCPGYSGFGCGKNGAPFG